MKEKSHGQYLIQTNYEEHQQPLPPHTINNHGIKVQSYLKMSIDTKTFTEKISNI